MAEVFLGIDIAKRDFHAALLSGDQLRSRSFPNNVKGFAQLDAWLRNRRVEAAVHACLEATGAYGEALAEHLHAAGHVVSIVNPARIKGFAQSELLRTKTDPVDAELIARFCAKLQPAPWAPPAPELRTLQGLVRRLTSLTDALTQEHNRAEKPGLVPEVAHSIDAHIAHLEQQIKALKRQIREHITRHPGLKQQRDLLTSIPGIGEQTAAQLLGETLGITQFRSAKELAAFAGLTPQVKLSGTSVHGKPRLSKIGNPALRRALYMPAVVALRYNPLIRAFAARLEAAGKHNMVIVGAVMRKLLHLAYGVVKSARPFTYRAAAQTA